MKRIHIFDHEAYHSALHHQIGNGIPVFVGYRQHGAGLGNILGLISRYVLPLFTKHVLPHAKSAVLNTISDVSRGKSLGTAMQDNSSSLLKNVGHSILKRQTGEGLTGTNSVETKDLSSVSDEPFSMAGYKKRRKRTTKKPTKKSKNLNTTKSKKSVVKKSISKRDIFSNKKWR